MSDLLTTDIQLLAEQEQQVAMLAHLASYSDMLIVVVGPEGSGKTTLAFELLKQHTDINDTLYVAADIMFGIPSLLRRIGDIDQLQLPENRSQTIDLLKECAEQRAAQGRSLLVVVDQAEQLDVDTLNEIAHLALLIPQGLSFVLFGVKGFEQQFRRGPAQAAMHIQPLMPLTGEGALALLQQVYSPEQPLPLSQTELVYLYRESAGWPGPLLLNAGEYFIDTAEQGNDKPAKNKARPKYSAWLEKFPITHIMAMVLLALALLFSYLYQPNKQDEIQQDATLASVDRDNVEDVLRGLPLPEKEVDYNYQPEPELEPEPEIAAVPVPEIVAEPEPEPQIAPVPKVQPKPAPVPKPTAKTDAEKLLAIKQGAVVQLFGSYEKANADKFVKQWQPQLKHTFYQYQTKHQSKAWFVVVVGEFKDKSAAQRAVQTWPAKLRAERPWVRNINDVHAALR